MVDLNLHYDPIHNQCTADKNTAQLSLPENSLVPVKESVADLRLRQKLLSKLVAARVSHQERDLNPVAQIGRGSLHVLGAIVGGLQGCSDVDEPDNFGPEFFDEFGLQKIEVGENLFLPFQARDPEGDSLAYSVVSYTLGATINTSTGYFSWTPTEDQLGSHQFHISVTDGKNIDDIWLEVEVENKYDENEAPQFDYISSKRIQAQEELKFRLSAQDENTASLHYSLIGRPDNVSLVYMESNGEFSWTPKERDVSSQPYLFNFQVEDEHGLKDQITVQIVVTEIPDEVIPNRAPVLEPIGNKVFLEHREGRIRLQANDLDGGSLRYGGDNLPQGAFVDSNGLFTWTPSTDRNASNITLWVEDSEGLRDSETINIRVEETLIDQDGDGFLEDVDCDDNDPHTRPLHEHAVNVIEAGLNICYGHYDDVGLVIRGSNFRVRGIGSVHFPEIGIILHGRDSFLHLDGANNVTVEGVNITRSDGFITGLRNGHQVSACVFLENANSNNLNHIIVGPCFSGQGPVNSVLRLVDSNWNQFNDVHFYSEESIPGADDATCRAFDFLGSQTNDFEDCHYSEVDACMLFIPEGCD